MKAGAAQPVCRPVLCLLCLGALHLDPRAAAAPGRPGPLRRGARRRPCSGRILGRREPRRRHGACHPALRLADMRPSSCHRTMPARPQRATRPPHSLTEQMAEQPAGRGGVPGQVFVHDRVTEPGTQDPLPDVRKGLSASRSRTWETPPTVHLPGQLPQVVIGVPAGRERDRRVQRELAVPPASSTHLVGNRRRTCRAVRCRASPVPALVLL